MSISHYRISGWAVHCNSKRLRLRVDARADRARPCMLSRSGAAAREASGDRRSVRVRSSRLFAICALVCVRGRIHVNNKQSWKNVRFEGRAPKLLAGKLFRNTRTSFPRAHTRETRRQEGEVTAARDLPGVSFVESRTSRPSIKHAIAARKRKSFQ